jgi:hypothetical protein
MSLNGMLNPAPEAPAAPVVPAANPLSIEDPNNTPSVYCKEAEKGFKLP